MTRHVTRWWLPDTIDRRLGTVLSLPTVVMLVLLGVGAADQFTAYRDSAGIAAAVRLELSVQGLVHELQRERGLTNGLLGDNTAVRSQLAAERRLVGAARARLDAELSGRDDEAARRTRRVLTRLDELPAVRTRVDAAAADQASTFQFFTDRIEALTRLDLATPAADRTVQNGTAALRALGEAKEAAARERGFLNGVLSVGSFRGQEYLEFTRIRAAKLNWLEIFARYGTDGQRASLERAVTSPAAVEAHAMEQRALAAADGRAVDVAPSSWWTAATTVIDGMRGTQTVIGDDLTTVTTHIQRQARLRAVLLVLAALAGAIGAVVLVVVTSRSITRPLSWLLTEARDVAQRRLPDAVLRLQGGEETVEPPPGVRVPELSSAEIRSVATALDQVQASAYRLAAEQAVLRRNTTESLANLGRRNQNLLRRQLGFISRLEQQESDPGTLANLFELDHLASRMRRNAESLLVLVGRSGAGTGPEPLPIADVVRAAMSEVEEYLRVGLRRLDDGLVLGSMVSPVAHLLAELLENGLSFSPPDSEVEIHGRWVEDGYLIVVVDHGIGMRPDDLERANARLVGADGFLSSPTKFLGHYVVAALARRIGARVTLVPSPVTGVTARIVLPVGALTTSGAVPAAPEPDPATRIGPAADAIGSVIAGRPFDLAPGADNVWFDPTSPDSRGTTRATRPVGVAAGPATPPVPRPQPDRTRNGLVKRAPRAGPAAAGAPGTDRAAATAAVPVRPGPRAVADRSPDDVRSMLGSFRSGILRGEQRTPAPAADPAAPAASRHHPAPEYGTVDEEHQ